MIISVQIESKAIKKEQISEIDLTFRSRPILFKILDGFSDLDNFSRRL